MKKKSVVSKNEKVEEVSETTEKTKEEIVTSIKIIVLDVADCLLNVMARMEIFMDVKTFQLIIVDIQESLNRRNNNGVLKKNKIEYYTNI